MGFARAARKARRADDASPSEGNASAVLLAPALAEGAAPDADALGSVAGSVELLEGSVGSLEGSVGSLGAEGAAGEGPEGVPGTAVEFPLEPPTPPRPPRPPRPSVREATIFDTAQSMTSSMQSSTNAGSLLLLLLPDEAAVLAFDTVALAVAELGSEPMTKPRM